MEEIFYSQNVTFSDPLSNIDGIEAYRSNIELLSGRNFFGSLLFRDAKIELHKIEETGE